MTIRFSHPQMLVLVSCVMAVSAYTVGERGASITPWLATALITAPTILGKQYKRTMVLAIAFLVTLGYASFRLPRPSSIDISHCSFDREVRFQGVIASIRPSKAESPTAYTRLVIHARELLFPIQKKIDGSILLSVQSDRRDETSQKWLRPGQWMQVRAKITILKPSMHPWEFDTQKYLARQGIFCQGRTTASCITPIENKSTASWFDINYALCAGLSCIDSLRASIVSSHRLNLGNTKGDLLSSIVLGHLAVGLDGSVEQLFRETGLSHLLAASGFNLTIVVASVYFLTKTLTKSVAFISITSLFAVVGFVLLAGNSPSVMRAAITCAFVITARWTFRRLHMGSALACSLILAILQDPLCVADIGLQLSYIATAGILLGAQPLGNMFKGWVKWKLLFRLCDLISVIVVAQLSVLPLQLLYFWQVGLLFLPANLVVDPLIAPVTCIGFLSSLIAMFPNSIFGCLQSNVCWLLDQVCGIMIDWMLAFLSFITSFGETQIRGAPNPVALTIYCAAGAGALAALNASRHLRLIAVAYFGSLVYLLYPQQMPTLTVVATRRQITVISSERRSITLTEFNLDGDIARYQAYCGARRDQEKTFHLDKSSCGVSCVTNERIGVRLFFLTRPLNEVDIVEAAKFAHNLKTGSEISRCVIVIAPCQSKLCKRNEDTLISTFVDSIDSRCAVILLRTAPRDSPQSKERLVIKENAVARLNLNRAGICIGVLE